MTIRGSIIAVVTPMHSDGSIDFAAFESLLSWQLAQGCDGIVVAGSTGEAATLTVDEKLALLRSAQKVIADRVPLIAGTGTNCTRSTIALTQAVHELGVRYSLLTCPYYNKPMQNGLLAHYSAVAEAVPTMNHILYSIPGRSMIRIETDTVIRLAQVPNIIGLKDSGSSIERIRALRASCGPEFVLLSGDDEFTLDCLLNGGDGVISVVANAFPKASHALVQAGFGGDFVLAKQLNEQLAVWYELLFCESNPIPVKALLQDMNKIEAGIRLPLTWLSDAARQRLLTAYQHKSI